MAIDWDLLNEVWDALGTWGDIDFDTGVSEISPAGQLRLDTNLGAAGNARAGRLNDVGEYPLLFTVEIKLYHDSIGNRAAWDIFEFIAGMSNKIFKVYFCADGLFVDDTESGETEVGTNLVKYGGSKEWQIWRFLVTMTEVEGAGTCDVFLSDTTHDEVKVGTAIPCDLVQGISDGLVYVTQYGYATNNMVTHIDYVKVATGLHSPIVPAQKALFFGANF